MIPSLYAGVQVCVLDTLLLIHLAANVPRKLAKHGPVAWAFAIHVGCLDGVLGS